MADLEYWDAFPKASAGYAWHLDPETLISGEAITFRLWHPALGPLPET